MRRRKEQEQERDRETGDSNRTRSAGRGKSRRQEAGGRREEWTKSQRHAKLRQSQQWRRAERVGKAGGERSAGDHMIRQLASGTLWQREWKQSNCRRGTHKLQRVGWGQELRRHCVRAETAAVTATAPSPSRRRQRQRCAPFAKLSWNF